LYDSDVGGRYSETSHDAGEDDDVPLPSLTQQVHARCTMIRVQRN